jgi:hypothetical protein
MKPILDWTKSKAEAYAPGRSNSVFAFLAEISEIARCGRRSGGQPPFDVTSNETRKRATFKSLAAAGAL